MNRIAGRLAVLLLLSSTSCDGTVSAYFITFSSGTATGQPNCPTSMSNMSMPCDMSPAIAQLNSAPRPQEPVAVPSTTLTASANGNSYRLAYSVSTNRGTTMFDGQMAHSSHIALTVVENGATKSTEIATAYYLTSPYVPLGLAGSVNGTAFEIVFNSMDPYPATLNVGASGPLAVGTYYAPGTNAVLGSLTETYAVEANNSSTLLLKVASSATLPGNQVPELIAYAVDASGHMTLSAVRVTLNGVTLSFN